MVLKIINEDSKNRKWHRGVYSDKAYRPHKGWEFDSPNSNDELNKKGQPYMPDEYSKEYKGYWLVIYPPQKVPNWNPYQWRPDYEYYEGYEVEVIPVDQCTPEIDYDNGPYNSFKEAERYLVNLVDNFIKNNP